MLILERTAAESDCRIAHSHCSQWKDLLFVGQNVCTHIFDSTVVPGNTQQYIPGDAVHLLGGRVQQDDWMSLRFHTVISTASPKKLPWCKAFPPIHHSPTAQFQLFDIHFPKSGLSAHSSSSTVAKEVVKTLIRVHYVFDGSVHRAEWLLTGLCLK